MSNVNAPNGFQYRGRLDGGSPTMGNTVRKIKSDYSTAIGFGDPVVSLTTGYIGQAAAGTTQIAGVFYGCKYLNLSVGRTVWSFSWPGTTQGSDADAYLTTDPQAVFVAQSNNTPITFADINRARKILGYSPSIKIEEGIPRFVEWFRKTAKVG